MNVKKSAGLKSNPYWKEQHFNFYTNKLKIKWNLFRKKTKDYYQQRLKAFSFSFCAYFPFLDFHKPGIMSIILIQNHGWKNCA